MEYNYISKNQLMKLVGMKLVICRSGLAEGVFKSNRTQQEAYKKGFLSLKLRGLIQ